MRDDTTAGCQEQSMVQEPGLKSLRKTHSQFGTIRTVSTGRQLSRGARYTGIPPAASSCNTPSAAPSEGGRQPEVQPASGAPSTPSHVTTAGQFRYLAPDPRRKSASLAQRGSSGGCAVLPVLQPQPEDSAIRKQTSLQSTSSAWYQPGAKKDMRPMSRMTRQRRQHQDRDTHQHRIDAGMPGLLVGRQQYQYQQDPNCKEAGCNSTRHMPHLQRNTGNGSRASPAGSPSPSPSQPLPDVAIAKFRTQRGHRERPETEQTNTGTPRGRSTATATATGTCTTTGTHRLYQEMPSALEAGVQRRVWGRFVAPLDRPIGSVDSAHSFSDSGTHHTGTRSYDGSRSHMGDTPAGDSLRGSLRLGTLAPMPILLENGGAEHGRLERVGPAGGVGSGEPAPDPLAVHAANSRRLRAVLGPATHGLSDSRHSPHTLPSLPPGSEAEVDMTLQGEAELHGTDGDVHRGLHHRGNSPTHGAVQGDAMIDRRFSNRSKYASDQIMPCISGPLGRSCDTLYDEDSGLEEGGDQEGQELKQGLEGREEEEQVKEQEKEVQDENEGCEERGADETSEGYPAVFEVKVARIQSSRLHGVSGTSGRVCAGDRAAADKYHVETQHTRWGQHGSAFGPQRDASASTSASASACDKDRDRGKVNRMGSGSGSHAHKETQAHPGPPTQLAAIGPAGYAGGLASGSGCDPATRAVRQLGCHASRDSELQSSCIDVQFSRSSQWQGSSYLGEKEEQGDTGRWDSVGVGVQGSGAVAGGRVGACSVHGSGSGSGGMSPLIGALHQPRAGRLRRERPVSGGGQGGCRGGGWERGAVGEGAGEKPRWRPSHDELPEEEDEEEGEYNAGRPGLLSAAGGDPRVAMARIPGLVDLTGSQVT